MAFWAPQFSAAEAFQKLAKQAASTKIYMQDQRAAMAQAGGCPAEVVMRVIQHCRLALNLMDGWIAAPGIVEYAKGQKGDPVYDIVAEYTPLQSALGACRDDLIARFPKDANNWLLYQRLDASGAVVTRTFGATALATALPLLDAVIAAVA